MLKQKFQKNQIRKYNSNNLITITFPNEKMGVGDRSILNHCIKKCLKSGTITGYIFHETLIGYMKQFGYQPKEVKFDEKYGCPEY